MKATFYLGHRLITRHIIKKNIHTIWVRVLKRNVWGRLISKAIKRHIRKHGVTLDENS